MTQPIHIQSRVGKDGVLALRVPLNASDADTDVLITIQSVGSAYGQPIREWKQFLEESYGSCAGMELVRHDQGVLRERETLE